MRIGDFVFLAALCLAAYGVFFTVRFVHREELIEQCDSGINIWSKCNHCGCVRYREAETCCWCKKKMDWCKGEVEG